MPSPSSAQTISGVDAPEFKAVVTTWLNGDDLAALQNLATLASDGNSAAQMLLASIEATGPLHAHVTKDMPRKERIELLRIPQGLSGKSWMTQAAKTEPLAQAILQSAIPADRANSIGPLFDQGEPTRAMLTARSMLYQGENNNMLQALSPRVVSLPDEALVLMAWAIEAQAAQANSRYLGSARISELMFQSHDIKAAELVWAPPDLGQMLQDPSVFGAVIKYSDQIEAWTPIRQFCDKMCSSTKTKCTTLGVGILFHSGPFPFTSPLESVISNQTYWNSPRMDEDMANKLPDIRKFHPDFHNYDRCFGIHLRRLQTSIE